MVAFQYKLLIAGNYWSSILLAIKATACFQLLLQVKIWCTVCFLSIIFNLESMTFGVHLVVHFWFIFVSFYGYFFQPNIWLYVTLLDCFLIAALYAVYEIMYLFMVYWYVEPKALTCKCCDLYHKTSSATNWSDEVLLDIGPFHLNKLYTFHMLSIN